eukprot:g62825.t1
MHIVVGLSIAARVDLTSNYESGTGEENKTEKKEKAGKKQLTNETALAHRSRRGGRQETSMHRGKPSRKEARQRYQDALWTWGGPQKTHLPRAQAREKKKGSSKERHMRVWSGKKKDHVVEHTRKQGGTCCLVAGDAGRGDLASGHDTTGTQKGQCGTQERRKQNQKYKVGDIEPM